MDRVPLVQREQLPVEISTHTEVNESIIAMRRTRSLAMGFATREKEDKCAPTDETTCMQPRNRLRPRTKPAARKH